MTDEEREILAEAMGWCLDSYGDKDGWWYNSDGSPIIECRDFHPDRDLNQATMVATAIAQKAPQKPYRMDKVELTIMPNDPARPYRASVAAPNLMVSSIIGPADALAHACLKALEGGKGGN